MKYSVVVSLAFSIFLFVSISHATDCDSNCEKHFDKWYQKPDLLRCQAEREAACRWGIEHCDFHPKKLNLAVHIIQYAHNEWNTPSDVHQCYKQIDNGSLIHSVGEKGYELYQLAEGASSKFNPYAILVKEMVKQVLRCACKDVRWDANFDKNIPNSEVSNKSYSRYYKFVIYNNTNRNIIYYIKGKKYTINSKEKKWHKYLECEGDLSRQDCTFKRPTIKFDYYIYKEGSQYKEYDASNRYYGDKTKWIFEKVSKNKIDLSISKDGIKSSDNQSIKREIDEKKRISYERKLEKFEQIEKEKIRKKKRRSGIKEDMNSINEGYSRLNSQKNKKISAPTVTPELKSARERLEAFRNR